MKRPGKPLDSQRLEELALHYVGRFATSRAKLATYLNRKLRERGWDDESDPDVTALVARFADRGYVDDAAFAAMKGRDLTSRGYGPRRVGQALYAAGIEEEDRSAALDAAQSESVAAALQFARRRRLGPFAVGDDSGAILDPRDRQRALAAFARAGHDFALAARILDLEPGADVDPDALSEP
ncbi:regulatory protein RecX [Sphingomicrobium sp. XHP0239]|uniref:regulatory protein RecX n=1 Tax=Sphingomicrobium maritimum TaxID=3133972 RepID=UPI0031CCA80B